VFVPFDVSVSGASGNGERTLEDLYRRHFPEAARLAFLLTDDRVLAEDLAQEAFVRLTGRFAHLRDRAAFTPYLRRTVINLAKNQYRRPWPAIASGSWMHPNERSGDVRGLGDDF